MAWPQQPIIGARLLVTLGGLWDVSPEPPHVGWPCGVSRFPVCHCQALTVTSPSPWPPQAEPEVRRSSLLSRREVSTHVEPR